MAANPFGPKELYGYKTLHREIGYYISRLEQYGKSLQMFDEALQKTPDDKRALIGRARARTKMIQYEGALEDLNRALSFDPDDLRVLADKTLNTYLICEFEQGLVENLRLVPKRQKPDSFTMGVMQCTEAIKNCLDERAGRPLRDHFKIIRKLAWRRNYAAQKPFQPKPMNASKKKVLSKRLKGFEDRIDGVQPKLKSKSKLNAPSKGAIEKAEPRNSLHSLKSDKEPIPKYSQPFPFRPLQDHTTNIDNYMAEKYLDAMYLDKIFLKDLQTTQGVTSPNIDGTEKIKQIMTTCYKSVAHKQELLRTRRPFYFIKYQEASISGSLKKRQKLELEIQQNLTKKEADALVERLSEAQKSKDFCKVLELAYKLKNFCDNKPKKLLLNKEEYLNLIYDQVCDAFYDLYRINRQHSSFIQTRRIYCILGFPLSRNPSADSVVDQLKNTFLDYRKKITEYSSRLENAVAPDEICWCYHELSRFHYEIKHYDLSRLYAKKCAKEAKDIGKIKWLFNSNMLLLKNNIAEHNKNDAKNNLLTAMSEAKQLNDDDKVYYLERCQEIIQNFEFGDQFGCEQLEKRENKIIQMMADSHMRDEVAHLFRQMAAMPASRRMTVIPGVKTDKKNGKSKGRAMSILPGPKSPANDNLDDIMDM